MWGENDQVAPRVASFPELSVRSLAIGTVAAAVTTSLAALGHLARLDLLTLALVPLVVGAVLPIPATLATRLVVAVGLVFCLNFMAAWLLGLVGAPSTPPVIASAILAPVAAAVGAGWLQPRVGAVLDRGDAAALVTGAVVWTLLWLPTRHDDSAAILSRLVSDGEDNAAHLGIVQAITVQHGLLFGHVAQWRGRLLSGDALYPPAFHLSVALFTSAVDSLFGSTQPKYLVRTYFLCVIGVQAAWATTALMAIRAMGPGGPRWWPCLYWCSGWLCFSFSGRPLR